MYVLLFGGPNGTVVGTNVTVRDVVTAGNVAGGAYVCVVDLCSSSQCHPLLGADGCSTSLPHPPPPPPRAGSGGGLFASLQSRSGGVLGSKLSLANVTSHTNTAGSEGELAHLRVFLPPCLQLCLGDDVKPVWWAAIVRPACHTV